ncbi:hypothetical protein GSI_01288 [Ganoderma sinense ZZ0214-1]|uniref:Uncharacterized protein n=1 Tax=Ganoderma sinense ZZ0214-1 TaxID=1077348 RepID=A0A2G8SV14_9APHY|nr:hypothetical protein GSI_01288 [Ganoderma sinense ZZ0214-1]
MPRAVIISKESSLKGLVTDARLPYPTKDARLASEQRRYIAPPQNPSIAQCKRVDIPRRPLNSSPGRIYTWPQVTLAFNGQARGISFHEIQRGSPLLLHLGNSPAFNLPVPQNQAEFRIGWPGYSHVTSTYSLPTIIAGRPITLWELACKVVECYASFWEHARRAKVSQGNERWDVKGFDFDAMVLTAVGNTDGHDAVFQATVETIMLL